MSTKNSGSQNNIDASCVNSAKQIVRQQELNQRIEFWTSVYSVAYPRQRKSDLFKQFIDD